MQDASVERLSRIIGEPRKNSSGSGDNGRLQPRNTLLHVNLRLAEGWFSLFLLVTVVYSTIWSVQAAGWVDHLSILTLTSAIGLVGGLIAAKQRRLPRWLVHPIAIVIGLLLAFWQTAGADKGGSVVALVNSMHQWFIVAFGASTSNDDSIFLFFITALGFLLAYISAWLLYRTRSPWLMILANAVVLLINLSNIDPGYIIFLIVFLIAALLLLLRFNLYESSVRWKRQGLRCSDDLGWEFMQAGALVSIGILILTWFMPWGYTNDAAAQVWSADNNPWVQLQNEWNRLVAVTGGYNALNHGNFTDTLVLGGNPNLNDDIVFTLKTDDPNQYLETLSYNNYDGRSWSNGPTDGVSLRAGSTAYDTAVALTAVHQQINVVNPPGEQNAYLLGSPQIASTDQGAQVVTRRSDGSIVAWIRTNGRLVAGQHYTVTSFASSADVNTLKGVPLPKDAPPFIPKPDQPDLGPPAGYYDPNVLSTYLQLPNNLDHNILTTAKSLTDKEPTMYSKVVALETYLRGFTYDTNINLPAGQEGVSWFLFRSGHRGFCNYFATAMAVMARELGIPARVVTGYTNGKLDPKTHQLVVRGSDAHAWTQVYFATYGWVNFEPSASFATFARPIQTTVGIPTVTPNGSGSNSTGGVRKPLHDPGSEGSGNTVTSTQAKTDAQGQLRRNVGIVLLGLVLLILSGLIYFSLWWRRLFRGYGIPMQIFGRMSLLASWAGISLRRSQTPYEYVHGLSEVVPEQAVTIERLGDIYVRDRWADPSSSEHPRRTGEIKELPGIWKILQPRLFLYVLRHPHFLRRFPDSIGQFIGRRWSRRRKRRLDNEISVRKEIDNVF